MLSLWLWLAAAGEADCNSFVNLRNVTICEDDLLVEPVACVIVTTCAHNPNDFSLELALLQRYERCVIIAHNRPAQVVAPHKAISLQHARFDKVARTVPHGLIHLIVLDGDTRATPHDSEGFARVNQIVLLDPKKHHADAIDPLQSFVRVSPRLLLRPLLVPNIAHILTDIANIGDVARIHDYEYINILTMLSRLKPDKLVVHYIEEPQPVAIFRRLLALPRVVPHRIIDLAAYAGVAPQVYTQAADVVILKALQVEGGIFMDTDVVALHSMRALRRHQNVMGREREGKPWLCNAVTIASKNKSFINAWFDKRFEYYDRVDGAARGRWGAFGVELPGLLAHHHRVVSLPSSAFFVPYLNRIDQLFQVADSSVRSHNWKESYAVHLWHSHAIRNATQRSLNGGAGFDLDGMSARELFDCDCGYGSALRFALQSNNYETDLLLHC